MGETNERRRSMHANRWISCVTPKRTNINTLLESHLSLFRVISRAKSTHKKSDRASLCFGVRKFNVNLLSTLVLSIFAVKSEWTSLRHRHNLGWNAAHFRVRWHWKKPKSELSRICDGNLNGLRRPPRYGINQLCGKKLIYYKSGENASCVVDQWARRGWKVVNLEISVWSDFSHMSMI